MNLGKIIYYHRKKQKMTQENLCHGICSASHLSKIENNTKEVNEETLTLLCNRLGISIEIEGNILGNIQTQLQSFYAAIERLHKTKAENIYKDLIIQHEYIQHTDLVYLYELYITRYWLLLNEIDQAEGNLQKVSKYREKFSEYELYVWYVIKAIYYAKKSEYMKGLSLLNDVKGLRRRYRDELTEYYYLKALLHSKLNQSGLAIHFGHKALTVFKQTNNTLRTLDTKTIISINLSRMGENDRAIELLQEILDEAELINNTSIKERALHNLGFVYASQKFYSKAIDCYYKSLSLLERNSDGYYITISNIAENLLRQNKHDQAAAMLEGELKLLKDTKKAEYVRLKILYLEAKGNMEKLISYLEKEGFNILEKYDKQAKLIEYSERIAIYHKKNGNVQLENKYLQKVIFHLKKIYPK